MKYKHHRTGREMEVGEHERVRRQILERIGWFLVEGETVTSTVTLEETSTSTVNLTPEEVQATSTPTIQGRDDFTQIKGVSDDLAEALYGVGFMTLSQLATARVEELTPIQGIGEKKAQSLIEQARELADEQ